MACAPQRGVHLRQRAEREVAVVHHVVQSVVVEVGHLGRVEGVLLRLVEVLDQLRPSVVHHTRRLLVRRTVLGLLARLGLGLGLELGLGIGLGLGLGLGLRLGVGLGVGLGANKLGRSATKKACLFDRPLVRLACITVRVGVGVRVRGRG